MNLELTMEDVRVVIAALGELPLKYSQAVHDKIRAQVEAQAPKDHSDKEL